MIQPASNESKFIGKRYMFFATIYGLGYGSFSPNSADFTLSSEEQDRKWGKQPKLQQSLQTHYSSFPVFAMGGHFNDKDKFAIEAQQTQDFFDYIEDFLHWLEDIINREYNAEVRFLEKRKKELMAMNAKFPSPLLGKILQKLPTMNSTTWDYDELMFQFNELRRNVEDFNNYIRKIKISDEKAMQKDYEYEMENAIYSGLTKTGETAEHTLREWEVINRGEFIKQMKTKRSKGMHANQDASWGPMKTLASKYNDIFNATVKEVDKKENSELRSFIRQVGDKLHLDEEKLRSQLLSMFLSKIQFEGADTNTIMTILKDENQLSTALQQDYVISVEDFFKRRQKEFIKSIEYVALSNSESIADFFIEKFTEQEQQKFLLDYGINNDFIKPLLDEIKKKNGAQKAAAKGKLSTALKKFIIDYLQKTYNISLNNLILELKKITYKDKKRQAKEREEYLEKILTNVHKNQSMTKIINISTQKSYKSAEAFAAQSLDGAIVHENNRITLPGKKNFAGDVLFSILFNFDSQPILDYISQTYGQNDAQYMETFLNFEKTFMDDFINALPNNKKDVVTAARTLQEKLHDRNLFIDRLRKIFINDPVITDFIEQVIENRFFGEISVKDYEFYANNIGVKGGSLGGDHSVSAAVDTIQKMYELGGITVMDEDLLYEALINYTGHGITVLDIDGQDIFKGVQTYLLGGALLAMFDEGFVYTQGFLDHLKSSVYIEPNFVHLYHIESLYYPASFLLKQVYDNVSLLANDIMNTSFLKSSYIQINNNIDNEAIPAEEAGYSIRWNTVAEKAEENARLYIRLEAGVLDMFENLANKLSVNNF